MVVRPTSGQSGLPPLARAHASRIVDICAFLDCIGATVAAVPTSAPAALPTVMYLLVDKLGSETAAVAQAALDALGAVAAATGSDACA